jgi:rhamnosyltransferase
MQPVISIVIPTKNGEHTIKKCLTGLAQQTYKKVEVIVVDSGSSDKTITIASKFSFVRIYQIEPSEFNHGLTRNFGISKAAGEYVVMTVQDAYPTDEHWLERMLYHFKDLEVIGVCGQQVVPHDLNKNPHDWFRPFTKPIPRVVHFTDLSDIDSFSPQELRDACGWDNVNAMYKKSALKEFPFSEVSFGEDMAWAKSVVLSGKKIIYDYNCRVYHYHHGTYDYAYKRTLTVLYFIYKNFGYVRQVRYTAIDYLKIIYRNFRYKVSPRWIYFNWNRMRASAQAYRDLVRILKISESELDKYHSEQCGLPPQGKQNVKV